MTLLSKTLLRRYFRVLLLTLLAFIAFLLTTRLKEIAELLAFGCGFGNIGLFILLLIPSIVPIALPIASLLAALLLFMKLSQSHELTTLRASGLSIVTLLRPLLFASALIGFVNFIFISEITTSSHLLSRQMIAELTQKNPLLLLQAGRADSLKGAFVQIEPKKAGQSAENLYVATSHPKTGRLSFFLAKEIELEKGNLTLNQVTLLTPVGSPDSLLVENCKKCEGFANVTAGLIHPFHAKLSFDYLTFRGLIAAIDDLKESKTENNQTKIIKGYSDIICRFSLAIAPFTFTLLGAAFGIEIGREKRIRHLVFLALIAALALSSFFIAKELSHLFSLSALLFSAPHLVMIALSFFRIKKIEEGYDLAF